jgi:hypothetical protein
MLQTMYNTGLTLSSGEIESVEIMGASPRM